MRSDWWKFNESMTSGTRPPVRYIRRGEEGVRASDFGPSENQASYTMNGHRTVRFHLQRAWLKFYPPIDITYKWFNSASFI